eukprot:1312216-Prymnesium_polylepis.1
MMKLDAKLMKPSLSPTLLNEALLSRIVMLLRPQMRPGVDFVIDAPSDEELGEVMCDVSLLTHVLLNIGQNAARFTAAGSIRLVCRVQASTSADGDKATGDKTLGDKGDSLLFAIRDTGPGIPETARK